MREEGFFLPGDSPWETWLSRTEILSPSSVREWRKALSGAGRRLGVDMETTGLDPLTSEPRLLQAAWTAPAGGSARVAVLDLFRLSAEERKEALLALAELFADPEREVIGHHLAFEIKFLRAGLGRRIPVRNCFDTMIASQLVWGGDYWTDEEWEREAAESGLSPAWETRNGTREKVWRDLLGRRIEVRRDSNRKVVRPSHSLYSVALRHLDVELDKSFQLIDWSGTIGEDEIRYAARDAAVLLPLADIFRELIRRNGLERVFRIEMACLPAAAEVELSGLPFDLEEARKLLHPAREEVVRKREEAAKAAGRPSLNPDSAQEVLEALRELAFQEGLLSGEAVRANGEELPLSSASETAERILQKLPPSSRLGGFLRALGEYRRAKKRADFLEEWAERVHPATGRLHPELRQLNPNGVGRFSAARPNVQQVPRGGEMRALFRAPEGRVLVAADYSAIEMRIMAELSGDRNLIRVFREGRDPHRATAAFISGKPEEEVTGEERQEAKALGFGLIYGMMEDTLRAYAEAGYGVSLGPEEARAKREAFFRAYPGIREWHEKQFNLAWDGGFREVWRHTASRGFHTVRRCVARTLSGRMRCWPGVPYVTRSGRRTLRKHGSFTELYNTPDQGTGADILKLAMARVYEELLQHGQEDMRLVCTLHDELVIEAPEDKAEEAKRLLSSCMLQAAGEILKRVPAEVECGAGKSWKEAKK